ANTAAVFASGAWQTLDTKDNARASISEVGGTGVLDVGAKVNGIPGVHNAMIVQYKIEPKGVSNNIFVNAGQRISPYTWSRSANGVPWPDVVDPNPIPFEIDKANDNSDGRGGPNLADQSQQIQVLPNGEQYYYRMDSPGITAVTPS